MQKARYTFVTTFAGAGLGIALLAGCGKNSSQTEMPGAPAATAVVAAEKNSFTEVTSHLDTGGNLYLYLGTAQWLDGLSAKAGAWRGSLDSLPNVKDADRDKMLKAFDLVTNLIKDSGFEDVSGFGMSSVEFEKGLYRTKTVLHHYPGRGTGLIWTAFGKQPHKLDGLDLLPATTAFAMFSDTDFQQLWSFVEGELTQADIPGAGDAMTKVRDGFEKGTGLKLDDTLASLGGEYGIIITLNDDKIVEFPGGPSGTLKFPEPGILLAMKVKDDLIFDRLETVLKSSKLAMVQTDKDAAPQDADGDRADPDPDHIEAEHRPQRELSAAGKFRRAHRAGACCQERQGIRHEINGRVQEAAAKRAGTGQQFCVYQQAVWPDLARPPGTNHGSRDHEQPGRRPVDAQARRLESPGRCLQRGGQHRRGMDGYGKWKPGYRQAGPRAGRDPPCRRRRGGLAGPRQGEGQGPG